MTRLSSCRRLPPIIVLLIYLSRVRGQQDAVVETKTATACNNNAQHQITGDPEVRVGFLVGSQRRPPVVSGANSNSSSYSHSPPTRPVDSRLLTHVFKFLMSKLNGFERNNLSSPTETTSAIRFKPIVGETFGDEQESVRQTIDLIQRHRVHVILGPHGTCQLEPTLAGIFNVPMISHYCNSNPGFPDYEPVGRLKPRATGAAASTFIQTKPPGWKIVRRVVALVRQLLSSGNDNHHHHSYYSQQLVLLYFKEQQQQRGATMLGARPNEASASNEANQYNTIGRLLELELAALLRDTPAGNLTAGQPNEINQRRRQKAAATGQRQRATGRPSLSVLNWHTTFHYGYTENPFRRLVRRHLFSGHGPAGRQSDPHERAQQQQQQWQWQQCSAQADSDDQTGQEQRRASQSGATSARASANRARNRTLQQHPASTYIIVGHSYEHLGLMLALDELGLLDFDGWPAAAANKSGERPALVSGRGQQSSTMAARPIAQQARRQPPSIVIGVDIEPHDERDDSVRFLRGLLMGGGGGGGDEHGSSGSSNENSGGGGDGNNQRPSSGVGRGGYELSSLASKYNHYMAIVPAKPSNPTELLDEMRRFYDAAAPGLGDAHEQTGGSQNATGASSRDLDRLTLRMLQFARLPMEAYYLHDSIDLLGAYFGECLRVRGLARAGQRALDECSRGDRMAGWFANRTYSGHIDRARPSGFDAESIAEGLYTIVARSNSAPWSQPVAAGATAGSGDTDEADEEFGIVQVGRFLANAWDEPRVELTVEPASMHQVWMPLWCASFEARHFLNLSTASESCAHFLRTASARANSSETIDDDDWAEEDDQANAPRLIVLFCLLACMGGCSLALMRAASIRRRRRNQTDYRVSCTDSVLECFAAGIDCADTQPLRAANGESSPTSECFNERDVENFLHIVHNLLLNPESAAAAVLDGVDTNGELSDDDEADRLAGQIIGRESPEAAAAAYSGSLRSAALKWQQLAEQGESETACGTARLRDQQSWRMQAIDLHCYMFPFPSCKFAHWLTGLHQLKEMLFKYQSGLSSKQQFVRQSRRWGDISGAGLLRIGSCRRRRRRCHSKSRSMSHSLLGGGGQSASDRTPATAPNHGGNRLSTNSRTFKTGIGNRQNNNDNNNKGTVDGREDNKWMLVCESPLQGRIGSRQATFFTGRHRGSPTVKLLLNKYKSTNECLCQLARLRHPAVVRLFGVAPMAATNGAANGVKSAQLIVERTGRASLRRELATLAAHVHLSASAHEQFKAHLWRAALTDLVDGLDYLHARAQIGFHGTLCATTCLVTSRWRLKLTGFHVRHMRRSLGAYKLSAHGADAAHEAASRPYLAPEVLAAELNSDNNLSAARAPEDGGLLLSARAMRLADIYSLGLLIYELLVGQEPWSCVELSQPQLGQLHGAEQQQQQRNKLLAERVRVDPSFRPPVARLDKILAPLFRTSAGANEEGDDLANEDDDAHLQPGSSSANFRPRFGTLKRLLEACWAHSPHERPQSLAAVWSRLETGLIGRLSAAGATAKSFEPTESSCRPGARANGERDCALAHYTRLVEETARERLALLRSTQELADELRCSLLPRNAQTMQLAAAHTSTIAQQLDCVHLCMFRFTLMPAAAAAELVNSYNHADVVAGQQQHIETLSRLLVDLDTLVASFRGHLHLWDSQVDSLLRYTVCAGDHLHAPPPAPFADAEKPGRQTRTRATGTIAHSHLLATFAFELIDLANRWQAQSQGHVQVRCALHKGPALAAYLMPQVNDSPGSAQCRRSTMNLARCILLGRTLQVVDVLEQSSQFQKIQVTCDYRRELVELSRGGGEPRSSAASTRLSLLPSLLLAGGSNNSSHLQQQQQAYVMMRRTQRVQARGVDMDTYWLLNGPRVTSSQRLTLPRVGARSDSGKSPYL